MHPGFAAGGATTAFIGEHQAALLQADEAAAERAAAVAAVLLYERADDTQARRLPHKLPISLRFELAGQVRHASVALIASRRFQPTSCWVAGSIEPKGPPLTTTPIATLPRCLMRSSVASAWAAPARPSRVASAAAAKREEEGEKRERGREVIE